MTATTVKRPRRLLTIGHSYAVRMNRRLVHEMARVGRDEWTVTAVGPKYFHGGNDLRAVELTLDDNEQGTVIPINAYLTRKIHVFLYGRQLRSILADNWDLVYSWEEPYLFSGAQIARWTPRPTPLVYLTMQSLNKTYPPPFNWIENYSMNRAAGWISCGTLITKNLENRKGYNKPMTQIPLGVDVEAFRPNPESGRAVLQKLGWQDGPPVIGFLGRFVPDKGLAMLMRVLDRLPLEWRAMFVGSGVLEPELRAWAARNGDRVRICTDVTHDHVPAYLNAMSVLCAPSQTRPNWMEQFGRMAVEAFATGVPVIGSDSGEIPFVLKKTGCVVGEKDEDGWTRTVTEVLTNPTRRREMAAEGIQRAQDEFSWSAVARSHLKFFDSLIPS